MNRRCPATPNRLIFGATQDWGISVSANTLTLGKELGMPDDRWVPVDLPRDVEYSAVLEGGSRSLRRISDAIASVSKSPA